MFFPQGWRRNCLAAALATSLASAIIHNACAAGRYIPDLNAREKLIEQQEFLRITHDELPAAISTDSTFQTLMGLERWEHTVRSHRTDESDKFKAWCLTGWFDTGRFEAYRADNLAASGHVDEAIEEINKSIAAAQKACDEGKRNSSNKHNLEEYLKTRMKLLLVAGRIAEALEDAEKLLPTQYKFAAAVILLEHGKTKDAETAFATLVNNPQTEIFESVNRYFLALSEEKNGKFESARSDYVIAARYFAMVGREESMKVCLNSAGKLDKEKQSPMKVSDLTPPQTNKEQLCKLIKFLSTEKHAFDPEKLKEVLKADSFEKSPEGSIRFRMPDPKTTAINLVQLGPEYNASSKALRLILRLNTTDCSITQDDCSSILTMEKVSIPATQLDPKFGTIEGYKVPAGLLEMTWFKGGFGSLYTLELLEGRSTHPNQAYLEWRPRDDDEWFGHIVRLLAQGKTAGAKNAGMEWQKKSNSELFMRAQAKIFSAEGKPTLALLWIDKAISKRKTYKIHNINPDFGDLLAQEKVEYLLKNHQVQAAAQLFNTAIPKKLLADNYALRAQIELAQKKYPEALADLKMASDKYFEEFRIVKRDETNKQIASLSEQLKQKSN